MYVIKRIDQGGGYLARSGAASTYTSDLAKARIFATREKAEKERCPENEIIKDVRDILTPE